MLNFCLVHSWHSLDSSLLSSWIPPSPHAFWPISNLCSFGPDLHEGPLPQAKGLKYLSLLLSGETVEGSCEFAESVRTSGLADSSTAGISSKGIAAIDAFSPSCTEDGFLSRVNTFPVSSKAIIPFGWAKKKNGCGRGDWITHYLVYLCVRFIYHLL